MDHLRGLLLKLLLNGVPAVLILSISGQLRVDESIMIAIILTFFAYILGDLFVLPRSDNTVATVADVILVFAILWVLRQLGVMVTWRGAVYTALTLGVLELVIFHPYLHREVRKDPF